MEKSNDQTVLRLYGARARIPHVLVALLVFFVSLALLYLIGISDAGVWLGISVLLGFVFVWGTLSYREAKGAVIRVTEQDLTLPAPAVPSQTQRVLSRHDIQSVSRILLHSRRGRRTLCILEIEQVNGETVRLWPSMVATEALAAAIERHMHITIDSKSGLWYQIGIGILVLLGLAVAAYLYYIT